MRLGTPAWRASIRIARRDALRRGSRARTALIAAMIGLPVAVISGGTVLLSTVLISPQEKAEAQLGSATAIIAPVADKAIMQGPYLDGSEQPLDYESEVTQDDLAKWTQETIQAQTGGRLVPLFSGGTTVSVGSEASRVARTMETDLRDPIAGSTVQLVDGRAPAEAGEVVVGSSLHERGARPGSTIRVGGERRPFTVVGVVGGLDAADLYGLPGSFGGLLDDPDHSTIDIVHRQAYLLDRAEPMTWSEVLRLNELGLGARSIDVVRHPPGEDELLVSDQGDDYYGRQIAVLVTIIATAVIIEITLLAGPAFAVGVRRQRRVLALIAATGGSPRQVARVVLTQALVIGLGAALAGAVLGVGGVVAYVLAVQRENPDALGVLDVTWWEVAATMALGTGAALLAAWFPSRQAARTDVVLELTGRRAQVRQSWGHPVAAVVILGAGAFLALPSDRFSDFWGMRISMATIVLVVGGIVAMPTLLSLVARLSGRFPLPVRLAARDVDRQRSRSTPAAAAIMATVAGLTALGIASFSDQAEIEGSYRPQAALGQTEVTAAGIEDDAVWATMQERTGGAVPGATLAPLGEITGPAEADRPAPGGLASVYVPTRGCPTESPTDDGPEALDCRQAWSWPDASDQVTGRTAEGGGTEVNGGIAEAGVGFSKSVGLNNGSTIGDPEALTASGWTFTPQQRAMLDGGGILVPRAESIGPDGMATLTVTTGEAGSNDTSAFSVRAPAAVAPAAIRGTDVESPGVVATPATVAALGLGWGRAAAVVVGPPLTDGQNLALDESLKAVLDNVSVYTERGYASTGEDSRDLLFLLLAGAGGLLVLIGTFTATGLAMADARADLATLAAVGASPAVRRAYSAAQALVIALLGAAVGVALGFVPGIAATRPLTAETPGTEPYLDVPWSLLLILVVAVPCLAALLAAAFTRSRLPLVRRLAQ